MSMLLTASSIKKLFNCTGSYLLGSHHFYPINWVKEEDSRLDGETMHLIAQTMISGQGKDTYIDNGLDLSKITQTNYLQQRLNKITAQLAASWTHHPLGVHLQSLSWPLLAQYLAKLWDNNINITINAEMNLSNNIILEDKYDCQLKGRIDRVDFISDIIIITDYKRKNIPTQKNVSQLIDPQLVFYAWVLSTLNYSLKNMIVGYWSFINSSWSARAVGSQAHVFGQDKGLISKKTPDLEELVSKMLEQLTLILNSTSQQNYHYTPGEWCKFCPYSNICRLSA